MCAELVTVTVTDRSILHSGSKINLTVATTMYKFGNSKINMWHLSHNSGRVTQICVFNMVKLGTSASSP